MRRLQEVSTCEDPLHEEVQGLTSSVSVPHWEGDVERELCYSKEPEQHELEILANPDMPARALGDTAASPYAVVGSPVSPYRSTVMGRAMPNGDLEMQPLKAGEGGASKSARHVSKGQKTFLYGVWPSRNKFFCRGLLMTGGETELGITSNWSVPNLCVWTCILAPCTLYFVWVFPHLWGQGCYTMPVATLMMFILASGFLLATCCSDPGIIPRREVILATDSSSRLEAALGYDALARDAGVPLDGRGGGRNLPIELQSRGYRWCRTCRIVRPPRASHCPDCDNCVLRYDHHCPFVNNCVGQRNYHFFFGFITSVLCLAMLVLPVLLWFLSSDDFEVSMETMSHVGNGVLSPFFYVLIACGFLVGIATFLSLLLWLYHLFLITTRKTTKEYRKSIPNMTEEPTLCAARGPRLFDPWALIDPRELIRPDEVPMHPPKNFCLGCFDDD